jgi:hypothetical protein
LTICGRANAGGRKGGLGGIPPNGSFLVFKTSKINHYGISRRRNYEEVELKCKPSLIIYYKYLGVNLRLG